MAYVLRFVQSYRPADRKQFMDLEAQFCAMEKRRGDWFHGRRYQPYAGREPTNTLVWETDFCTLDEVQRALDRIAADPEHEELFQKQAPYMTGAYTEIDEVLEF